MLLLTAFLVLQTQALPQRRLVEDLRLASPGEHADFVALGTVAQSGEAIYVSDWRAPAIHHFDARGRYLGQVGRAGDGPGEYRIPVTIGTRGDSLWLWDPGHHRATVWDAGGRVVRTTTIVDAGYGGGVLLPSGEIALLPNWTSARAQSGRSVEAVRRFTAEGRLRDTLWSVTVDAVSLKIETGPQRYFVGEQPFADGPLITGSADGLGFLTVDRRTTGPAVIGLTRYGPDGRRRWHRELPYAGVPLDPSVIDSVIRGYTAPTDPRAPKVAEGVVRAAVSIPSRAIPVLTAMIGADGRIWLRRPTPAGHHARYTVLRADGTPEFEVVLPGRGRVAAAGAAALWVVEMDADDVPSAVRYRIQR